MAEIAQEYSEHLSVNGVEPLIIQLPATCQGVSLELKPTDIKLFEDDPQAFINKFIVPAIRSLLLERKSLLAPPVQ